MNTVNTPVLSDTPVKTPKKLSGNAIRFCAAATILMAGTLFSWLAGKNPQWIADKYVHFSRAVQHALGSVFGILPFSAAEFLLYAAVLGFPAAVIAFVILTKKHGGAKKRLTGWLSRASLAVSILLTVFITTWAVGYSSAGLAYALSLEPIPRGVSSLTAALDEITENLNAAVSELPLDEQGEVVWPSFDEMSDIAADAWASLAAAEPYFADVDANRIKPVFASRAMSYTGLTGVFVALTGEANVNSNFPPHGRIFTMAHELAHSFCINAEGEANFAAYLACLASGDPYARYSGYLCAFVYCYNALVGVDQAAAFERWHALEPLVEAHISERTAYWQSFESPVKDAATSVNDAYLKVMSQPAGVKSYGTVVDLILADHAKRSQEPVSPVG